MNINPQDQMMEEMELQESLAQIEHKILVLSGKGGVGKSTVASNLAMSLALDGKKVGLLDIDLHGPSIPKIFGLDGKYLQQEDGKILPLEVGNLKIVSVGFMLQHQDDAVIWRGPLKYSVIKQFIKDVKWGALDYLIVDSPPGTGDEPLSIAQLIKDADGAIVVTTPQNVALADVRKSITFCHKLNLPVIGVIENMSGFVCPHCGERVDIFKVGGGEKMASEMNVNFLGRIPIDPNIVEATDEGKSFIYYYSKTETAKSFLEVIKKIEDFIEKNSNAKPKQDALKKDDKQNTKEAKDVRVLRIGMPTSGGKLNAHFGRSDELTIYDLKLPEKSIVNKDIVKMPPHEEGSFPNFVKQNNVNLLIVGGIGPKAIEILEQNGVDVLKGVSEDDPESIIRLYIDGKLKDSDNDCDHGKGNCH